jgi:hypothetical protein
MKSQDEYESILSLGKSAMNGMLLTLIIPFCFMIFMSVSMNKVWSLYNLLQLISNIINYKTLKIPANSSLVITMLINISQFSMFQEPNINKWLNDYVFSKTPFLMAILINQGMFISSLIVFAVALAFLYIGFKV